MTTEKETDMDKIILELEYTNKALYEIRRKIMQCSPELDRG